MFPLKKPFFDCEDIGPMSHSCACLCGPESWVSMSLIKMFLLMLSWSPWRCRAKRFVWVSRSNLGNFQLPSCSSIFPLIHEVFFQSTKNMLSNAPCYRAHPGSGTYVERLFNLISTLLIILQSLQYAGPLQRSRHILCLYKLHWCCLASSTYPLPLCYVKRKY